MLFQFPNPPFPYFPFYLVFGLILGLVEPPGDLKMVIDRPGVAGAVLQAPLLFID